MRTLNITLSDSSVTYTDGKCAGVIGEHNATQLVITLPSSLFDGIDYHLLAFSDGTRRIYSEEITTDNTKSAYRSGNTVYCKLWQQLTESTPIDVTVEAYKIGEDGSAILVRKSLLIEGLYFELAATGIPEESNENAYGLGCDLENIVHGHDNLDTLDMLSHDGDYLNFDGDKLITNWDYVIGRPVIVPGNGNRSLVCNSIEYNKAESYYTATFGYNNYNNATYCLTCGRFGSSDSDDLFCVTNGRIGHSRSAAFHVKESLIEAEVPIIAPNPPAGDSSTKLATTQWVNGEIAALAAGDHTHSEYASADHTHNESYYTKSDANNLLAEKSDLNHAHDERYYTELEIDHLLANKSDTSHTHSNYAATDHTHDGRYYTESEVDTLLVGKSNISDVYNKTEVDGIVNAHFDLSSRAIGDLYGITDNIIETYYNKVEVNALLAGKSGVDHTHDGRYYTEAEVNALLAGKASVSDPVTELAATEVFNYTQVSNVSAVYDSSAEITYYQTGAGGEYEAVTGLEDGDSVTGYWVHTTQWYEYAPTTNSKHKLTTPTLTMDIANVIKFILPTPTDLTVDNSILIYMYTDSEVAIHWGNDTMYAGGEIPTIESGKYYDLIFTYNPIAEKWCVGAVNQSASS